MERIVEFGSDASGEAATGRLVGIVNRQEDASAYQRPAALLFNAGIVHRIGPHRLNVKLARALAEVGVASIRFDLSGLGDSPPAPAGAAYEAQAALDISAAADVLEADGARTGFVAIGMCSGADNAYRAALQDSRIIGLVLLDPYAYETPRAKVERALEKARDIDRWKRAIGRTIGRDEETSAASSLDGGEDNDRVHPPVAEFGRDLEALAQRGVRVLIRYTTYVEELLTDPRHFHDAFKGFDFAGNLDVEVDRQSDHTYVRMSAQKRLFDHIAAWYEANWPRGAEAPAPPPREAGSAPDPAPAPGAPIAGLRRAGVRPAR
ncbi:MAG: hypothetical protein AAFX08_02940 [Pseudomonadota bacterium]